MSFSLKQLQEEQVPWVKHNFGDRPAWMPLSGISEEWGEFMEAWHNDHNTKVSENMLDAIADIVIFTSDFCSAIEIDLESSVKLIKPESVSWLTPSSVADYITITIGKLHHSFLKHSQNIRTEVNHIDNIKENVSKLIAMLNILSEQYGKNLLSLVEETWKQVSKRDWKKNSVDGGRDDI